jgi:hypothetical protein
MLSITTISGQRFDLYPNETIEVNMGGISLLNLADRTVSYTNSFKLPRTANNEAIFAFASHPTRNNRPSINVVITKGLFQKSATLKVKEFTGDYNCEVVYDNGVLDLLSSTTIDTLFDDGKTWETYATNISELQQVYASNDADTQFESFRPVTYTYSDSGSLLFNLLNLFSTKYNITFNGTLFDDTDFNALFMILPYLSRTYTYVQISGGYYQINVTQHKTTVPNLISVSTLLKAISQLFMCDVKINGRTITINKVTFPSGINIETLSFKKTIYSGYLNQNNIVYELKDSSVSPLFGSDTFIADGVGNKDVLKLGISVPLAYGTSPKLYDTSSVQDLQIYKAVGGSYPFIFNGTTYNIYSYNAAILTMSGYYSTILNPIFANPVILSATGYIDPLTADTIMNDRVIKSVKLGGRYWVDDMKYNLTTGNSVLKLIKI